MATNFFERQAQAHRKTSILIFYFVLAVLAIIAVLNGLASLWFGTGYFDVEVLPAIAGGVVLVVAVGAAIKMVSLAQGGRVVAESLGGRVVDLQTVDFKERQLLNVVEEMALASGVPTPQVYLLDREEGINAFAAGYRAGDAVIGVTRGCLEQLSRDELQGVIGHEFSHVLNGDMRLNIRLMGVLSGILSLAIIGRVLMEIGVRSGASAQTSRDTDRDSRNSGVPLLLMGVALFVIGWIGVFFAKLIKAAVSRQREFLADASSVQFTRNPNALCGALSKIQQATSRLVTPRAEEASHLFFSNGLSTAWLAAFSTHPPIELRIRALDPGYDPSHSKGVSAAAQMIEQAEDAPMTPDAWLSEAGQPGVHHLAFAAGLLAMLPDGSREALRSQDGAEALVYFLLISADADERAHQLAGISIGQGVRKRLEQYFENGEVLGQMDGLSLVDLVMPVLRQMVPVHYEQFRTNVATLVQADAHVSLFEYLLHKTLVQHLDTAQTKVKGSAISYRSLEEVLPEVQMLLFALAEAEEGDVNQRAIAYAAGVAQLGFNRRIEAKKNDGAFDFAQLDAVLKKLARASFEVRRQVLVACGHVVMHNGVLGKKESALLRVVADILGCPIPPFVQEK